MALHFHKYEGLGNDFILVESARETLVSPADAAKLCDRRRGVGGDGVLLVLPPARPESDARMRVLNADGSIPEMCGNGLRCVALHLARARGLRAGTLRVETDAGERVCTVDGESVTVDMGPVTIEGDCSVRLDGESLTLSVADVGNPHAVAFGDFSRADVARLGPALATHVDFPRGTNVEFAHVAPDGIHLVVWERGVGLTLACGTGACATVAVARAKGLAGGSDFTRVHLPGGTLDVRVDGGRATMRGPARYVFSGSVAVDGP